MAAKKKYDRTKQKETLVKVLEYIKHYRAVLVFSLILAAVTVACTLYLPILTGDAINLILSPGQVDFNGIKPILYKGAAVIIIGAAAQWIMNICNNRITYAVVRDIRQEAFEKIERLPLKYIDSHPYGDIVSRIIADADQFSDGLLMGFTQLFSGVLTIAGTLIFMLTINIPMTAAVVVLTPISFFVAGFIAKKTFHLFKKQSETRGEQTTLIDEMINNQKVVKAFGQEEKVMDRFNEVNERLRDCSVKATFFSSITNPATRFVNSLVYAAVAVFGSFFSIGGGINVGQLYSFLNYANQYTKPFNSISSVVTELQNALACAGRLLDLIYEETEVPDADNAEVLQNVDGAVKLSHVNFSYDPKQKLIENTEAFVRGRKANNCLLFGDAGTGKSSSIKGILNRYYDEGLRIIEVYKHQFQDLNDVIAQIKNRNYKFIIYMDDLSFEEFEIEYKYLKAVIEGGLEKKPDNILIYATSNRRHLVREKSSDKLEIMDDDDLHSSDTVQEKLSLVYRFGVRIYYGAPSKKEFQTIVKALAERNGITMPEDELLLEANKWELSHGGLTGRTAQQFIDHLLGVEKE